MCTLLFSWKTHPDYPLVLLANRDEFLQRETRTAHWWEDLPTILAGRDLQAGGTWMGMNQNGRFAAVTNYRKLPLNQQYSTSRGDLVKNFLTSDMPAENYFQWLEENGQDYEGFNLVFGTLIDLYYFSNRGSGKKLTSGIYGLSNHLLDTPWHKVEKGKKQFRHQLNAGLQNDEVFFDILNDREQAPDESLPDTGIGLARERLVSSIFIESADYGTRLSTVVTIHKSKKVHFHERSFHPLNEFETTFQIS